MMDFQAVWTATLAVGIVGLVVGILLSILGKVLAVESDERIDAVREVLPGNNCGGCGLAGCDACAKAIVEGTVPVTVCPVGGAECTEKIAEIMGDGRLPPEVPVRPPSHRRSPPPPPWQGPA